MGKNQLSDVRVETSLSTDKMDKDETIYPTSTFVTMALNNIPLPSSSKPEEIWEILKEAIKEATKIKEKCMFYKVTDVRFDGNAWIAQFRCRFM